VTHVEDCPDIGPSCASSPPPAPYLHHVKLAIDETDLDVSYGVTRWLAAEARLGLRVVDVTPTFYDLDGRRLPIDGDIHHKKETIAGPTDPWLVLRFGARAGRFSTAARLGATLPLGSTVPDPYELSALGLAHEHIQLGSGTVMPLVGGTLAYATETVAAAFTALWFFSLYENSQGFRAPNRAFYTLRATLTTGPFRPYAAADLVHDGREVWHGVPGAESFVRTDLLLGGGLGWMFREPWQADVGVRVRVLDVSDGPTLEYPALVQIGLSTWFDLARP
jgi:hypothetical protein